MEIFKSKYQTIIFEEQNSLFIQIYDKETENMEEEEFISDFTKIAELAELHKPKLFLSNSLNMRMILSVEIQEWVAKNIYPRFIKSGLTKTALQLPDDMITQLSIEQAAEEEKTGSFIIKYFSSENEARKWLFE